VAHDARSMAKSSTKYINEVFIRPRDIVVMEHLRYRRSNTVRQAFRAAGLFLPK
jgi:hypothetical protein